MSRPLKQSYTNFKVQTSDPSKTLSRAFRSAHRFFKASTLEIDISDTCCFQLELECEKPF